MSDNFDMHQIEEQIVHELALAESSRPDDPVVDTDDGWGPDPTNAKRYETRLLSLLGAVETDEAGRTVQATTIVESVTVVDYRTSAAEPE